MGNYANFIKDKRVILVGPAQSIRSKEWGEWIDSFDIVVRTNGAIFLTDNEEYKKDYGGRCDVLYVNVQFHREISPFPLKEWKDKGVQFLCFKGGSRLLQEKNPHLHCRRISKNAMALNHRIEGTLYGPLIVQDLLDFGPKELYITGMDFYVTKPPVFIPGDYREYFPEYLPKKIRDKADIKNIGRIDPHGKASNTQFLYNLMQEGKLKADSITTFLMGKVVNGQI